MAKSYDDGNHFYSIPAKWDEHPDLDGLDRYLLMKIHNLAYKRGYCFASQSALAKMIGLSRYQVDRRLRDLERLGAVTLRYNFASSSDSARSCMVQTAVSTEKG